MTHFHVLVFSHPKSRLHPEYETQVKVPAQDEDRDPRQVLARPTWVADRGSGATVHNGLEKIWVATSVWPMAILVCSVWRIPIFRSVRSGQYPYFGLFGLANTQISACSVWPIPVLGRGLHPGRPKQHWPCNPGSRFGQKIM